MTANREGTDDPFARERLELLSALERCGIRYRPDRLEEALVEYVELKRLMAVVAAATRPPPASRR